jgi:uncharacterized protein YlxW (UPF0749 family)
VAVTPTWNSEEGTDRWYTNMKMIACIAGALLFAAPVMAQDYQQWEQEDRQARAGWQIQQQEDSMQQRQQELNDRLEQQQNEMENNRIHEDYMHLTDPTGR